MGNYQEMANSSMMFLICGIPIILVLVQSVLFIRLGMKRTTELGMDKVAVQKAITNSAVFSILPSLPIVISVAALMPTLGKYLPWLRLSVIGSVAYETACAEITLVTFGLVDGIGSNPESITGSIFTSAMWVMCAVSVTWPLLNAIGLKLYDKTVKSAQSKGGSSGGFMRVASGAMFIGLICVMFVPRAVNVKDPVGIVTCIVAGLSVLFLDWLSKKTKIKILSDFSFPLAMIFGMAAAIVTTAIIS